MGAMTPNRLAFVHGGLGRGVRAFSGACQAGVGRKEKGAGRVPTQVRTEEIGPKGNQSLYFC